MLGISFSSAKGLLSSLSEYVPAALAKPKQFLFIFPQSSLFTFINRKIKGKQENFENSQQSLS
jgi:hypothetical protein